ncbi:uncharacterized protein LOC124867327 [Girardinichthys multiradiatus]|uniref:uncharacterized protein LOC124867327 n=1 Tax=Girardinichthys multiradiatus TaxID=208333 RepID=UPI001FABBD62|nr:uncharacterized protein LOC124867327 [Girardinichthys multiradiatus]
MLRSASDPAVQGQSPAGAARGQGTGGEATGRQGHSEAPSCSTPIQRNMARCFPGLFKDKKGKAVKRAGIKRTPVAFFLLHKPTEKTPKHSEELTLLQAGLGKKTVQIPEDANHKEILDILCETYPKIKDLEGGWLIHKAMGGSGQRKLNVITPEEMGYTGSSLVKTWGGRGCLYIMPIEQVLDTTPLPFTAKEFQAMPRARCSSCHEQLLSVHVQTCFSTPDINESDREVIVLKDDTTAPSSPVGFDKNVSCPLCDNDSHRSLSKYMPACVVKRKGTAPY